jgi:hypothetical protein
VISGFNTDINYDNVVYHVQTEDKGLKSRLIVSLVYDRGTILARKNSSYEDLASGTFDENALSERLQKQHKLMCAAIKAGRINDLKSMSASEGKAAKAEEVSETSLPRTRAPQPVAVVEVRKVLKVLPATSVEKVTPVANTSAKNSPLNLEIADSGPIIDAVSVIEEVIVLPADAVAVVSELSGVERPTNTKLSVEMLGETKFKGGDRKTVNFMVCRGTQRKVVGEAQIMIKVLGSAFRPLIFHAKTDRNGLAKVHLQLPHFQAGRAAILIRAMSEGEEVELRRIMTPG